MFGFTLARVACFAALAGFAAPAAAQSVAATPSPAPSASAAAGGLQQIGHVVTSDRRFESSLQSSRPTYVVDRSRIEAYGARTVADALAGVPGVTLFAYGGFGAQVDYGIRGALSSQTLVLLDGVPIADPTTGAVALGQFSTVGVERIEIVESGSSTLYGSSASGGVINIVTSVPRGTYLEASSGSFADRDVRAGVGNGSVGFSYERHVDDNAYAYPALAYSQAHAFPAGIRVDAFGDESAGRLSLDLPLVAGFRVRARADSSATYIGAPGRLDFLSTTGTQATSVNSALVELERAGHSSIVTLALSGSTTRLDYNDPVANFGESDVYTGRSALSLKDVLSGSRGDLVAGIDLSRESAIFTFPTTPDFAQPSAPPIPPSALGAAQAQSAAYVQLGTSPVAGSRFTAGLRAENDSPKGSVLAPSFGGTIRSGNVRFAGNVGESFRVPTLQDLYYPGFSNPNLLPEKAQTADVTVAYDAPRTAYSVGWFDRNGSNFIVLSPTFIPINARRASSAGLVFTATTKPVAGIVAEASYTNLYRALDLTTGGRLPRNPVGSATFSLVRPFARDRYSYGLRWGIVGSGGDDRSVVAPPLGASYDAYDSLDAFFRYKLAPGTLVTVRGFNLGGEQGAPIFGYPSAGRRVYLEVSTR